MLSLPLVAQEWERISGLMVLQALGVRVLIAFLGLFTDLKSSGWDNEIIDGLDFLEHSVLQLPFFLMSFMRYISPSLDNM